MPLPCLLALALSGSAATAPEGLHTWTIGSCKVTALGDGSLPISTDLLAAPADVVRPLLEARHLKVGPVETSVNAFLVESGGRRILVDTGALPAFGPGVGRLQTRLKALGIDPASIQDILITHMHGDHIGGLLDAQGHPAFPKATVHIAKAEFDHWTSPTRAAETPEARRGTFTLAMMTAKALHGHLQTFIPGGEVCPGIQSMAAIGHTPGHTCYLLTSKGQRLLFIGDLIHMEAIQMPRVDITVAFDSDAGQARESRQSIFARAAAEKLPVAASHLPFPGAGHLEATGPGYRWIPLKDAK